MTQNVREHMPMDHRFDQIASDFKLPHEMAQELLEVGFVVLPGPHLPRTISDLATAYDSAISAAHSDDVSIGGSTIRVDDFVNRGPVFDEIYLYGPILAACCLVILQPFKLSTMHARTVRPNSRAQALHVDFRAEEGWPLVGFILMVDEFRADNGATRFVPGSHFRRDAPAEAMKDPTAEHEQQTMACGPAGSMIIYNGSVWHGHAANLTAEPRRSIQGAFIRRNEESGTNHATRIRSDTLGRIGSRARYLLDL